jgi:membrane fusion protein, multidrug efflux system
MDADTDASRPPHSQGMNRHGWLRSAMAALLVMALPTIAPAQEQQLPVVTVAKPLVKDIVEDDEYVGRFEPSDEVAIRSRVAGYLDTIHFRDGQIVKVGDPLFTIDQRQYQAADEAARSQVDVTKSVLEFAKAQLDRAEQLTKSGNLAVSNLDDRRRDFLSAQAELQGAEASLRQTSLNLEFTQIKAPLDGRIGRRLVSTGNLVQPDSTLLTTIVAIDPIDFYFDIDERAYFAYARDARTRGGSMQEGAGGLDVSVRLADRQEQPFKGKLDFADNRLDKATGTMRVRARFDNKDGVLQPGMFGRINVPGSLPHPGILIPDEAIGADQNRRIVYEVNAEGEITAKPVRLGPRIDGYRVIREGLTGDETLVVNGLVRVRPGVKVKPEMSTLPPVAAGTEQ